MWAFNVVCCMHFYAVPFRETSVYFCVLVLNIGKRELDKSTKCKMISTNLGTNWGINLEIDVRKGIVTKFSACLYNSMFKISWLDRYYPESQVHKMIQLLYSDKK